MPLNEEAFDQMIADLLASAEAQGLSESLKKGIVEAATEAKKRVREIQETGKPVEGDWKLSDVIRGLWTPGPWRVDQEHLYDVQTKDGKHEVATAHPYVNKLNPTLQQTLTAVCNAALISRVPELIDALSDLVVRCEKEGKAEIAKDAGALLVGVANTIMKSLLLFGNDWEEYKTLMQKATVMPTGGVRKDN